MVSIEDVLHDRLRSKPLTERVVRTTLPTAYGTFDAVGYKSLFDSSEHIAFVRGDARSPRPMPAYLHTACRIGDVFGTTVCVCKAKLQAALDAVERVGTGVIVYLGASHAASEHGAWRHLTHPATHVEGLAATDLQADRWRAALAADILRDLGVQRVSALDPSDTALDHLPALGVSVVPTGAAGLAAAS